MANKYCPDYAVPPGATLLEVIEERGMSQARLADLMGRPKKTINEIIKGKAALTPETANQLERVLQIPAKFWNTYESNYRADLARIAEAERLEREAEWLKQFPVPAMAKHGWIERQPDRASAVNAVLAFFGVATVAVWNSYWGRVSLDKVAFRKSNKFEMSKPALAAWLRQGEIQADGISVQPYNRKKFAERLRDIRALAVKQPAEFQPEMQRICAECGVAVVFVRELPHLPVFGITRWREPNRPVIQLSLRCRTEDHFWFSFFHEAGHVILHANRDFAFEKEEPVWEDEADKFAEDALIPPPAYAYFLRLHRDGLTESAVSEFAQTQDIPPGIVVGRLEYDKLLPYESRLNKLKRRFKWREPRD